MADELAELDASATAELVRSGELSALEVAEPWCEHRPALFA